MRRRLDIPAEMTPRGAFLQQYRWHLVISTSTFLISGGLFLYLLLAGSTGFYRMGNVFAFFGVLALLAVGSAAWPVHLYRRHKHMWEVSRGL